MINFQKSSKLIKIVENKTVAIVAPSDYLVGKGLGQIIDNYDIVCRLNYMYPGGVEEDYGSKVDVMFYNCSTISLEQMSKHFDQYPEVAKQLKLVFCSSIKVLGSEKWNKWKYDFTPPVVSNFQSINKFNIDFDWNNVNNYKLLVEESGSSEPNTGILAIMMILKHNPKSVFITGYTFYSHKYNDYFKGYATRDINWKGRSGHRQEKQLSFFKSKLLPHIKVDSYLNDLLELKHTDVQELPKKK